MMEILLARRSYTARSTEGDLLIDGVFECYTLEDPVREGPKVAGRTAIPAGRYQVRVTHSPRFNELMPLLLEVPDFTGIRIHPGNDPSDTEGCILVGDEPTSTKDDWIGKSRKAYVRLRERLLHAQMRGEEIWITITDTPRAVGS